ncbi:NYN domain-containing protein [Sphaerotilus sp.]|uniref:NYN domain-containing protein n=1 Tax=Sphaerotilus sp. TaxID=2093942 RepID=UPI00286E17C1|nr:NYN domain-containing protein [Sphaerotilus sp.]
MKSALFVDFDNVYSGLRKLDPMIAERFGRQPLEWVQWLIKDLALPDGAPTDAQRRLLVRRVYLNPQVYQRFRPSFNHGGFEIVDCPAMTSEGKTSTDIHMVLDMVDLLQHQVHYDEFIVFSADADFTPVLRKLRRWDRRTTVLAVGFPSAAYRASADLLIDTDLFVRDALGMGVREFEEPAVAMPLSLPVSVPAVMPLEMPAPPMPAVSAAAPLPGAEALVERIRAEVQRADLPVPCARLASRLMHEYPGLAPDWLGQGGFRRFLDSLDLAPLLLDWSASGGHLYDPVRHVLRAPTPVRSGFDASDWGIDPALLALIRQVHDTTGVPLLSPRDFRALFEAVAADVAAQPFQLNDTGKRVRDLLREAGHDISRESVNWVLRGLLLCGHEFGQGEDDVPTLSYRLVGNLIHLCRREQVVMDESTPSQLQRWLTGRTASE